jgi:hypothetical protein
MTMGLVVLVVLVVLVLVLFLAGFRGLALLLLLALLALWAYSRSAVRELPSAPVILPSDGGLYPDGHDGSGMILQ